MRWKQADITALRERARAGEDISAIATALGRTLSDIRRMAARLSIKWGRQTVTNELMKGSANGEGSATREPRST